MSSLVNLTLKLVKKFLFPYLHKTPKYLAYFVVADDQVSDMFSIGVLCFSPLPSQSVLSSVPNFMTSVCSFAQPYKTERFPVETDSERVL